MAAEAEIGIFGGSGLYELLDDATEIRVDTPYGEPSDAIMVGDFAGRRVAFLPRHGRGHRVPPHRINYRANVWALAELGVSRVLAPCAVGALQPHLEPGTFVVLDQFVDRTRARPDTFHDGAPVTHVSMADPYCPQLRDLAAATLVTQARPHQADGTIVVINGPRFSTRAESRWFSAAGWDVVGMTQYPEIPLIRERGLCALGLAMVTDFDAGVEGDDGVAPVSAKAVVEVFRENIHHLRAALLALVEAIPTAPHTACRAALDDATM